MPSKPLKFIDLFAGLGGVAKIINRNSLNQQHNEEIDYSKRHQTLFWGTTVTQC